MLYLVTDAETGTQYAVECDRPRQAVNLVVGERFTAIGVSPLEAFKLAQKGNVRFIEASAHDPVAEATMPELREQQKSAGVSTPSPAGEEEGAHAPGQPSSTDSAADAPEAIVVGQGEVDDATGTSPAPDVPRFLQREPKLPEDTLAGRIERRFIEAETPPHEEREIA